MEEESTARFTAFYRQHYSLIVSTCFRRLSDFSAAEDATAEVFRIAWDQFKGGDAPSVAWLYGVARNVVGNEYRRSKRSRALRDRLEGEALVTSTQINAPVLEAMSRLKSADREILFMSYWEDLAGDEIAAILTISAAAVWVRLSRARDALRRQLESTELAPASSGKSGNSGNSGGQRNG
ncbi:MAG: RNA polymerase sigma factor [Pseudolysinimonas sp.]|uniref:RNA polymerase sigma factor n=1 Tax=Pseudolysinimonas sp. TaxID=2680009 RepID=UPI0032643E59